MTRRAEKSRTTTTAVSQPASAEPVIDLVPEVIRGRGPGRPWQPGQSGNPSGMPKDIAPAVLEARRLALSWAPKAIGRLAELLDDEDSRVVAVAATALLDRAGVKPHTSDAGTGDAPPPVVDVEALRATLAARLAAMSTSTAALPAAVVEPEATPPGGSREGGQG